MNPIEQAREALTRIAELTPARANARDARDLHLTVKAIAEVALARLAQAGGGSAVTEAPSYYIESIIQPLDDIHVGPGGDCEWVEVAAARDEIRRRIEAALHPQSAAGEEGK